MELKHTEADLAHERDLLQALMDNIPDTIYSKTRRHASRASIGPRRACWALLHRKTSLAKPIRIFRIRNWRKVSSQEEQELIRSGQSLIDRVEYNPTPEGQPRWLATTKVPLRMPTGRFTVSPASRMTSPNASRLKSASGASVRDCAR